MNFMESLDWILQIHRRHIIDTHDEHIHEIGSVQDKLFGHLNEIISCSGSVQQRRIEDAKKYIEDDYLK